MKTKKFGKIHTYSLLLVFLFIAIISCNKNPYNRLGKIQLIKAKLTYMME